MNIRHDFYGSIASGRDSTAESCDPSQALIDRHWQEELNTAAMDRQAALDRQGNSDESKELKKE